MLPRPKMNKINDTMFCISMERDVHLFYLITNSEEKAKQKVKKVFGMITYTLTTVAERIELVTGNNSNLIFVKTKNNLVVLEIIDSKNNGTKDSLQLKFTKNIPDLITVLTSERVVIALSATQVTECKPALTQSRWRSKTRSGRWCRKRSSFAPSCKKICTKRSCRSAL